MDLFRKITNNNKGAPSSSSSSSSSTDNNNNRKKDFILLALEASRDESIDWAATFKNCKVKEPLDEQTESEIGEIVRNVKVIQSGRRQQFID